MMNKTEQLARILAELGLETDKDGAVEGLFDGWLAEAQAKANRTDTPAALLAIVRGTVAAAYRRRGDEGTTSSSVGGQSYAYSDLSAELGRRIVGANLRVFRP